MTTNSKWILIIVGIILVLGIGAYASKSSILSHYQKYVEEDVARRTKEIIRAYDEQKKKFQEQIASKQAEISKKDAQIRVKEQKIKESEARVAILQKKNAELLEQLRKIVLPITSEESRKRLKELGYEVCN